MWLLDLERFHHGRPKDGTPPSGLSRRIDTTEPYVSEMVQIARG